MLVNNYSVGFTFEISNDYSEIKQSSYEAFEVMPETTLHYFVKLDDEGQVDRAISINRDNNCESDQEFNDIILENIKTIEQLGFDILDRSTVLLKNGRAIERVKYLFEDIWMVVYFMRVKNSTIVSSTYIQNDNDEYEQEIVDIFESIELK